MRKISSLLKGLAAATLLLLTGNVANAAPASIFGDYTFTSDVTYGSDVSEAMKAAFPATFDFDITIRSEFNANPKVNNFVIPGSYCNINYNASTGIITPAYAQIMGDTKVDGEEVWIGLSDATGSVTPDEYEFEWTVDANGVISFPTFTLVVYAMNMSDYSYYVKEIIATYKNGTTGSGDNGGGDDDDSGTPPASIFGDYTFTADVTYGSGVSEAMKAAFPATFDFDITIRSEFNSNPKVNNFVIPGSYCNINYNASTGIITPAYAQIMGDTKVDGEEVWIGLSDATGSVTPDEYEFEWTVNSKGVISFPTFTLVVYAMNMSDYSYYVKEIIATYKNGTTASDDGGGSSSDIDPRFVGKYNVYTSNGQMFEMEIDNKGYLVSFAGNSIDNTAWGNTPGYVYKDTYYITQRYFRVSDDGSNALVLGGSFDRAYESPNLKLSYDESTDKWTLSDFTLWLQESPYTEAPTQLEGGYAVTMVLKEGQENPLSKFEGTHNIANWWKASYPANNTPTNTYYTRESDVTVPVSINGIGQLTAIAGFTLPADMIGYGYFKGDLSGNTWTLELNQLNNKIKLDDQGQPIYILGGPQSGYNGTILDSDAMTFNKKLTLTYDEASSSMSLSDFTIWKVVVTTSQSGSGDDSSSDSTTTYELAYVYSSTEIAECTVAAPEPGEGPADGDYVVYNDGVYNSELKFYNWWDYNDNGPLNVSNPNGSGRVLKFTPATEGSKAASFGFNMEKPNNTGILHNATLNFKWYGVTVGTSYQIRLTGKNTYNYNFTVTADNANKWNTTSFNIAEQFPALAAEWNDDANYGEGYVFAVVLIENTDPNAEENPVIYFNEVYYSNVDENWEAPEHNIAAPESVPVPDYAAEDVFAVFSTKYVAGTNFGIGNWSQSTQVTNQEIDGQKVQWLRNFNYLGYEFDNTDPENNVDLSDYDYMRVDMWTAAENVKFGFTPITHNGNPNELSMVQDVTPNQWNTYVLPLADWTEAGLNLSEVFQIKLDQGTGYDCYVANVLFFKSDEGGSGDDEPTGGSATFTGSIDGSVDQTSDGSTVTYDYTWNYKIVYNENGTLTVNANVVWKDGEPFGQETWYNVYVNNGPELNGTKGTDLTTTETFTKGQTIPVRFFTPIGGGSILNNTIEYVVGSSNSADASSIAGLWSFNLNGRYQGQWSQGSFVSEYEATVSDNIVFFRSLDSDYNIVAELTDPTTLLFKKTSVMIPDPDITPVNVRTQVPYINSTNTNDMEDLTEQEFTAIYNPEEGTITFPANSGLLYGFFGAADGAFKFWEDAFDFVSAQKLGSDPILSIDGDITAIAEGSALYVMFDYTALNIPEGAEIYANFVEVNPANNKREAVEGSPAYFAFEDMADGTYTYTVTLTAELNGEVVATSDAKTISNVTVGIDNIEAEGASARYFNLQGVEVANPVKGGVYIRVEGNKATKIVK